MKNRGRGVPGGACGFWGARFLRQIVPAPANKQTAMGVLYYSYDLDEL